MSFEQDLATHLERETAITAIVGSGADARIYPVRLPQTATATDFPAISYRRVSASRVRSTTGPSKLVELRIQVDVWALTYAEAKDLADALRVLLDQGKGMPGVQGSFLDAEADSHEHESKTYRVRQDWIFWTEE